jgi:phospholipase D1/2
MLPFCGFLFVLMNVHRSHHEKLVIVDNHICFIGGLDLCFGRYDSPEHKVGDVPPLMWPGKDYYNPR